MRLAVGFVAAVLLLLVAYFVWSSSTRARLDRRIAELSAAGEPMTIAALQPKSPDDSVNAMIELAKASVALNEKTPAWEELENLRDAPAIPLQPLERQIIEKAVAEKQAALDWLAKAAKKPDAVSDVQLTTPLVNSILPRLNTLRWLARLCQYAAMHEFDSGRHDAAIERLTPIENIARAGASHPFLIGALTAIGCRAIWSDTLIQFAPDLKIGTQPGDVTPDQLRRTIAQLLDHRRQVGEYGLAMRGERLMQLDTFQALAVGSLIVGNAAGPGAIPTARTTILAKVARPVIYDNALFCLDATTELVPVAEQKDLPAAKAKMAPTTQRVADTRHRWSKVFASMLMPPLDRAFATHFRQRTDENLAAVALALRWYQVDHGGKLPERLADLVPDYLPTLPIDLISGKPFGYRPGGDDPIVWSVGQDETDDGGSEQPAGRWQYIGDYERWVTKDAVVHLTRRPRAATQPAD